MIRDAVEAVRSQIEVLPFRLKVAFIADCAERSIKQYTTWATLSKFPKADVNLLYNSCRLAWVFTEGKTINFSEVEELAKRIHDITPDTEDYPDASSMGALDSPCAVGSVLDYLLHPDELKYCLWAMEHALFASDDLTKLSGFLRTLTHEEEKRFEEFRTCFEIPVW